MNRLLPLLLLSSVCLPACQTQDPAHTLTSLPPVEVYFSPKGGCTEAVVKELSTAQTSVLVQAYSFTSAPIAKALLEAHQRGVKVEVILDKSQRTEKYSEVDFLLNAGIPTQIDARHAIAHNKVMVIDGATVITGSFNFTKAAEQSNAENLLVIRSPELAAYYTTNWSTHAAHSDPCGEREKGYSETHHPTGQAERVAPVVVPASRGYVASRNSDVFHRPGCKAVAKISAENLVHYGRRDEALQLGKKPCHECNP